jgi:hypothetical protein
MILLPYILFWIVTAMILSTNAGISVFHEKKRHCYNRNKVHNMYHWFIMIVDFLHVISF